MQLGCCAGVRAFLVMEEEGRPNVQQLLAHPYVMNLSCETSISEITQRVRMDNGVDNKALAFGEGVSFRKIECVAGSGFQNSVHAGPSEAVKTYFPNLYTPKVSFDVSIFYGKMQADCCTVM